MKITSEELISKITELKEGGFDMLEDVTAVDYKDRFELTYRLRNIQSGEVETVKVDLEHENPKTATLVPSIGARSFRSGKFSTLWE